ncbi:M36 family metallopeptidase [Fodinicola feengrottensis]|uniref:M36 family metallopeptidase n=1 Tax=Fodinicola feengrottensis TaxID=435914 RepID=UPI0013D66F6F|nr:M36 family metallopeptidase [Fodinicola feengrottensis]
MQAFYFANVWHDHLQDAPIGFTEAAGNFQQVNSSGQGIGGDPMHTQALDGASVANGLPDANRIDNARIATPPDGQSAIIQMYLYHLPGAAYPSGDPFLAVDSTNEADSTYHEYTNALPQRLLVDANNAPVLNSWQGRACRSAGATGIRPTMRSVTATRSTPRRLGNSRMARTKPPAEPSSTRATTAR